MPAAVRRWVVVCGGMILPLLAGLVLSAMSLRSSAAQTPAPAPTFVQPTSDPTALQQVALVQRQITALNRGNVDEVMALFDSDPVYEGLGSCRPTACVGQAAVRQEVEREVMNATNVTTRNVLANPPTVRIEAELRADDVRAAGFERLLLTVTAEIRNDHVASLRWTPDSSDPQTTAFFASQTPGPLVAELPLGDPRPCIPNLGQRRCDAVREALWNGDAQAWATRGITAPDARFNETVVFRVRAGDPGAISNVARVLGAPYLKVTRVRFAGEGEVVDVTNLGGGPQDLSGWTLRSPARGAAFRLPAGVTLQPGQTCQLITGSPGTNLAGVCRTFTTVAQVDRSPGGPITDVWPDDDGQVVLYYDALDLLGDDTLYSADPANQPPPPNLQRSP